MKTALLMILMAAFGTAAGMTIQFFRDNRYFNRVEKILDETIAHERAASIRRDKILIESFNKRQAASVRRDFIELEPSEPFGEFEEIDYEGRF